MCKFYSGFGGVRAADSRINFRPVGQEIAPRIRYKNLHQPSDCLKTSFHERIIWVADFKKNKILKSQRLNFTF